MQAYPLNHDQSGKARERILLIEDDPDIRKLLQDLLERLGYAVAVAEEGESGFSSAVTSAPDLILIDVYMPGTDGFTVARRLHDAEETRHIPIIFVTAANGVAQVVQGLELGAMDYIVKPFEPAELAARVKRALRQKALQDELASQALMDSLTGLHNRRYLMENLEKAIVLSARYGERLSCLMLDLDHFKQVNDTYGHPEGDLLLKELAATLAGTVRASDTVGRYGGEEFLVICPSTDMPAALLLAVRIRESVEAHPFGCEERPLFVTVSVGCATYEMARDPDGPALLARADAALYRAKQAGRNCVRGQ